MHMGHVWRKEFDKRKINLQLTESNTSMRRVSACDHNVLDANYVRMV